MKVYVRYVIRDVEFSMAVEPKPHDVFDEVRDVKVK